MKRVRELDSIKFVIGLLCLFLVSACSSTRYLKDDEILFHKQKIKDTEEVSKADLALFYQIEPNRRFPIYVWFYETGKKSHDVDKYEARIAEINAKYDQQLSEVEGNAKAEQKVNRKRTKKIRKWEKIISEGNLLMRWGEPVQTLDSAKIKITNEQFKNYLWTHGHFRGNSTYNITIAKRKAKVVYYIDEGPGYLIDTLLLQSPDSLLRGIISSDEENSQLKVGEQYVQENLTEERLRIENLLKNNGYFDFNRRYVDFDVDTTVGDYRVGIRTVISNRGPDEKHKVFKVDSVIFVTDANTTIPNRRRESEVYKGVTYSSFDNRYSYKVLSRRLFIRPQTLYSRERTLSTQRQLANLDIFRFVNVNYDSTGGKFVANIFASPLKRQQFTSEAGLTVTYGYPGPFVNFGYLIRNVFGGLENLQISARGGIEGVPSATDFTNILANIESGLDVSLIFPQFLLPGSDDLKTRFGRFNPKTTITGGFAYNDRPEYRRRVWLTSLSYSWSNAKRRNFTLTPLDIQVINTTFQDSLFVNRLRELQEQGNNLINSFKPSFVSSSGFSGTYALGDEDPTNEKATILRFAAESGGTFLNFFGTQFLENRNLEYYQYLRSNLDFRKRTLLAPGTVLAYRINIGVAYPYSIERLLPYEKYFFAGGATSNRAWRPRRLGPGSYTPLDSNGDVSYAIEQPGEVILESSAELRQDLTSIFELAFFVDAGNIWVTRSTDTRKDQGGDLNDAISEIAVGSGVGLRLDFTYFIFRFDAAFKVYDPARQKGSRFFLDPSFNTDPAAFGQKNESPLLNIAIGYPF